MKTLVRVSDLCQQARQAMDSSTVKPHILESISDGVFTVNHQWRLTSFNRAAENITGVSRDDAIGRYCWEVLRSSMCKEDCPLRKTMTEKKSYINIAGSILNAEQKRIPVSVSTALLHDENGEVIGGVETFRDARMEGGLRPGAEGNFRQGGMVSRSPLMKRLFSILPEVAKSESTVLIEGDTGTGKEMLAKELHDLSLRRDRAFVAINCGALPDTLLESELFGYKAGAFTDALSDKPGYFEMAEGGTIMLDEIGETSPAFQAKLLRVLEEREFQPLGGVQKQHANVRILAATNRNLEGLIEQGLFREDLFYRINIVRLTLPRLRERREDIPLLVDRFVEKLNRRQAKAIRGVTDEAMRLLNEYDYPGNIRELENAIEHAFILCSQGELGPGHLPEYLVHAGKTVDMKPMSIHNIRQTSEEEAIRSALERNGNNRLAAARELGMHKTTLFRKLKKYKIRPGEGDGRSSRRRGNAKNDE